MHASPQTGQSHKVRASPIVSPVIAPGQTNGEMKEEDVDNITLCTIHHRQKVN